MFPQRRLKSLSSAVLMQGHLKEQSIPKRQMEAIRRPLEKSQRSKRHICISFPRHRLERTVPGLPDVTMENINQHEEHQDLAAEGFVANPSDMDFGRCSVLLDLTLPQLLRQTFLQIQGEGSNMTCHKAVSHSLCTVPCCFIWLIKAPFSCLSLHCCRVPLHLHSNL